MSDFGHGCSGCGDFGGNHFSGCEHGDGNTRLGGDFGAQIVFAIFVLIGVILGAVFPPLGAAIIVLGAKITDM